MSVSYSSWESIIDLTNRFYTPSMQLFYTHDHIHILCNIIAHIGGFESFEYVITRVPLLEPIVQQNDIVFISKPLVAKYINMAIEIPQNRVNYVHNINIFDSLMGAVSQERKCGGSGAVQTLNYRDSVLECLQAQNSPEDMARFMQTLRLVLMAVHFTQHNVQKIPFGSHTNFKFIECAVRKPTKRQLQLPDEEFPRKRRQRK